MEYLLYGLARDEKERAMETLLSVRAKRAELAGVRELAARDGFHSFRIATYNGEAPDFAKASAR